VNSDEWFVLGENAEVCMYTDDEPTYINIRDTEDGETVALDFAEAKRLVQWLAEELGIEGTKDDAE
jgi:hypothetical protein